MPKKITQNEKILLEIIHKLTSRIGKNLPIKMIYSEAILQPEFNDTMMIDRTLKYLKMRGEIFEPHKDIIQAI